MWMLTKTEQPASTRIHWWDLVSTAFGIVAWIHGLNLPDV